MQGTLFNDHLCPEGSTQPPVVGWTVSGFRYGGGERKAKVLLPTVIQATTAQKAIRSAFDSFVRTYGLGNNIIIVAKSKTPKSYLGFGGSDGYCLCIADSFKQACQELVRHWKNKRQQAKRKSKSFKLHRDYWVYVLRAEQLN